MLGHMFTTWGVVPKSEILDFSAMNQGLITIDEGKFFSVLIEPSGTNANGELLVKLTPSDTSFKIAYSLDGKDPILDSNLYVAPFVYPKNATVKAVPVRDGVFFGKISEADFVTHKAIGKKVILTTQPSIKYTKELKEKVLVNGVSFTGSFDDGEWLGFEGNDAEFIIDFEDTLKINKVSINFHNKVNSWVHHPKEVIILGSTDGKSYYRIGGRILRKTGRQILNMSIEVNENCSFLKVIAKNQIIPDGFNGAGNPAWIFLDEVEVY
jgi:hexosaminidase